MNGNPANDDSFIADLVGGGTGASSADPSIVAEDLLCGKETIAATILGVPLRPLTLADALVLMRCQNLYFTVVEARDTFRAVESALEVMLLCRAGSDPAATRAVFTDAAIRKNAVMQFAAILPANGMTGIITAVDEYVKQATETQVEAKSPGENTGGSGPGND